MSSYFILYGADGLICGHLQCPDSDTKLQSGPAGGGLVPIAAAPDNFPTYAAQNYVLAGTILPKIAMGLAVNKTSFSSGGMDEVTITGVPVGATANITGVVKAGPETVTDGELIVTSTTPGAINVKITFPPMYFDWSVTLNAV